MEKKEYIKPEMKVYQIETPSILADSETLRIATDDEEYDDFEGDVFAD